MTLEVSEHKQEVFLANTDIEADNYSAAYPGLLKYATVLLPHHDRVLQGLRIHRLYITAELMANRTIGAVLIGRAEQMRQMTRGSDKHPIILQLYPYMVYPYNGEVEVERRRVLEAVARESIRTPEEIRQKLRDEGMLP